jgi:hypothetical protein
MIVVGLVDFTRLEVMDRFRSGRIAGFFGHFAEFVVSPRPIDNHAASSGKPSWSEPSAGYSR